MNSTRTAFAFLEKEYGFQIIERTGTFVEWAARGCHVLVVFERPTELTVVLGEGALKPGREAITLSRTHPLSPAYDAARVLRLYDVVCTFHSDREIPATSMRIQRTEDIPGAVAHLATVTRQYAGPLLRGVSESYSLVRNEARHRNAEYTRQVPLRGLPTDLATTAAHNSYEEVKCIADEYWRTRRNTN